MKPELLAPAGDIEAGYAALYYGADAVYLGLQKFSARATATNFDETLLNEFTAYAHHLGRKVYAAVNTVLQEHELQDLLPALDVCSRCQVDAVILQDLGVARVISHSYPELEMHASTQMAVHNKEGAAFLQSLGFSRVVLARELSLAEIQEISALPGLETEAFIHGALCYSYSGLCQFSALEHGRSANRGKCLYPCRGCYQSGGQSGHVFSMKDMALQAEVLKMPVTSLKIEGRKKSALYVAAVTKYYRGLLDGKGSSALDEENIKQIFSRPWCKFHFNGKDKSVTDKNFVGHRGLPIGKIEKIANGKIGLTLGHQIGRFDGLQIDVPGIEKPVGFSIQNIRVNHKNVFMAQKGEFAEIDLPPKLSHLKIGLPVYLSSSTQVKASYPYNKPKPGSFINAYNIQADVHVMRNKALVRCENFSSEVCGNFDKAQNTQAVKEAFASSFGKTGGTPFQLVRLNVDNPDGLFVPLSKINELRRDLYSKIVPQQKRGALPLAGKARVVHSPAQWKIKTDDLAALEKLDLDQFAEIIYLLNPATTAKDLENLPQKKIRLSLPTVCRKPQMYEGVIRQMSAMGYNKWEASNYWHLGILPLAEIDLNFDSPLYTLNSEAAAMAQEIGASGLSFSLEDTLGNIKRLSENSPLRTTLVVYQDVPLFTSAVCVRENPCRICSKEPKWLEFQYDGKIFDALSKNCETMLFDRRPFCIAAEASAVKTDFYRAEFVYKPYSADKVKEIMDRLFAFRDVENPLKGNINNLKI